MRFTKAELRSIYAMLSRLQQPLGARPLGAAELVEIDGLLSKTQKMIVEAASRYERGDLVLSWRIPRDRAPTLNQYAYLKGWQKTKLRQALDDSLRKVVPGFPRAMVYGDKKRWVRVTRFSTQRVDDLSIDVLGGKMPVDSLKRIGVIVDDDDKHIHREPRWEKCAPGSTHLLIEVYEVAYEQVANPEPQFAPVDQVVREDGPMTKYLKGTT